MNPGLLRAVDAARRFAQLIHYHDHHPHINHNYGHKPQYAWAEFRRQFRTTGEYTAVCLAFAYELTRLKEAQARRSGGPLPPLANRS